MEINGKELLVQTKQYAKENRFLSWWHFFSTMGLLAVLIWTASSDLPWIACFSASFLAGLVMVRMFVLYHDYLHGAILQKSIFAKIVMHIYGLLVLSPPAIWKHTHDDHHKNNCKSFGNALGSFPIITTQDYAEMTSGGRRAYRVIRNPLVIVFGYLTSFFWNKSLRNFLIHPIRNWWAGVAVALHVAIIVLASVYSVQTLLLGFLFPLFVGSGVGAYLFYAQHNFPGMKRKDGEDWDYVFAALKSSSYLEMGFLMRWFTGNIGFHHVHHLNAKIPFYRLPEAMSGISELQRPISTTLQLKDVIGCLRLKLWDSDRGELVSFGEEKSIRVALEA